MQLQVNLPDRIDSEAEDDLTPLPETEPQSTTMLDFFQVNHEKKRKMESKVVTNGGSEGHKSQSPPAKKRIAEVGVKENCDDDESGNKNGVRISNFFRPISKTEFIKESREKIQKTTEPVVLTVKAIVHSPEQLVETKIHKEQKIRSVKNDNEKPAGEIIFVYGASAERALLMKAI